MGVLICDDLTAPINDVIGKEKLKDLMDDKDFKINCEIMTGGFTFNINDFPIFKRNMEEVSE